MEQEQLSPNNITCRTDPGDTTDHISLYWHFPPHAPYIPILHKWCCILQIPPTDLNGAWKWRVCVLHPYGVYIIDSFLSVRSQKIWRKTQTRINPALEADNSPEVCQYLNIQVVTRLKDYGHIEDWRQKKPKAPSSRPYLISFLSPAGFTFTYYYRAVLLLRVRDGCQNVVKGESIQVFRGADHTGCVSV